MARLFQKKSPSGKKLPHWYCTFQVPTKDGGSRQVHRSTGCTTKKEALPVALRLEKEAQRAAGSDDETAEAILAKVKEAGELAVKKMLNASKGRQLIGEIMKLSGVSSGGEFTVREWVDDWIREKEQTVKVATAQFYRSTTNEFLKFLGPRADDPLDAITTKEIRDYRDSIKNAGRTAKTANHQIKTLRSMFGDAVKVAALLHNPAAPIKALDEVDSYTREPFTEKEVTKLLAAAPCDEWKGVILLGAMAGLRIMDACRLTAANLDLKRRIVNYTPAKTDRKGTTVEIPLHPDLVSFFERFEMPTFPKSPLFPDLARFKQAGGNGGPSAQFKAIMKKAGVDGVLVRSAEDGAPRDIYAKTFHSLRHTFTSWLAKVDVPQDVRMKMTGHTGSTVHQKYTHQEISTLRAGVERIPSLKNS